MYKVTKLFADLKDNNHVYNPGDVYPREGLTVTDERIKELSGSENKRGEPLIALVEEKPAETEAEETKAPAEEKPAETKKKGDKKTAAK